MNSRKIICGGPEPHGSAAVYASRNASFYPGLKLYHNKNLN